MAPHVAECQPVRAVRQSCGRRQAAHDRLRIRAVSAGDGFAFGPYQLDTRSKRLLSDGEPIAIGSRQFDLLRVLLSKPGHVFSKDQLIQAAWPDVAVSDNSLEQAISSLRRTLDSGGRRQYIETLARRGYRFAEPVTRLEQRASDDALDALLANAGWLLPIEPLLRVSRAPELWAPALARLQARAM